MRKQNQRSKEKRKIALLWLDTAAALLPGDTLFIPMRHTTERTGYNRLCTDIVKGMEASFENSIYHGIKVYSTHKIGVLYLAFEKSKIEATVGYIKSKNLKTKQLKILYSSRYTRKNQILLMLEEGYSKDEIRVALGKTITPQEELLLQ